MYFSFSPPPPAVAEAQWSHDYSALDSGSSGSGLSPIRGHSVVFFFKTLYSHSASLHPGVMANFPSRFMT